MNLLYNTRTKEMHHIRSIEPASKSGSHAMYMSGAGGSPCQPNTFSGQNRHRRTRLPDTNKYVVMMKLGRAMYESVPEEHRGRITGEFKNATAGKWWYTTEKRKAVLATSITVQEHIILSPPPEPEPKTAVELLDDIENELASIDGISILSTDLQEAIRKHHAK